MVAGNSQGSKRWDKKWELSNDGERRWKWTRTKRGIESDEQWHLENEKGTTEIPSEAGVGIQEERESKLSGTNLYTTRG